MSINRRMYKDVVHIYSGVLLRYIKEWNNAICTNMDGPVDSSEWSKSFREGQIWYHLYVESKMMVQMNLFTKQK